MEIKMKIAYVITGLGLGGAEIQVCNLADQMVENGHEVVIISLTGNAIISPLNNVKVIELGMTKGLFSVVATLFKMRNFLVNVDIVHSHMFHANIFSRLLKLFFKIPPLICSAHSSNEGGRARMFVYRITDFLSDLNTNVSQSALNSFIELRAMRRDNSKVVHNAINHEIFSKDISVRDKLRKELGIESDFVFITVGRLEPEKNHKLLLEAFHKVSQQVNCAKLLIVGNGSCREELMNIIREKNLNNKVIMLGALSNVSDYLNAADAFVLSSIYEGFGMALAEAMSCEKIVLSTSCGGVESIVRYSSDIVSNNCDELADKMFELTKISASERCEIGKNNRLYIIENFSFDSIVSSWLKFYSGLIK